MPDYPPPSNCGPSFMVAVSMNGGLLPFKRCYVLEENAIESIWSRANVMAKNYID